MRKTSRFLKYSAGLMFFAFECTHAGWEAVNPGGGGQIQTVVCDPQIDGRLFLCSDMEGLYRSDDHGLSWRFIGDGLALPGVLTVAVDPVQSSRLYAATPAGIHWSEDGGTSWTLASTTVTQVFHQMVIDPLNPERLYAAPGHHEESVGDGPFEIYVSTDRGLTWEPRSFFPGIGRRDVYSIRIDPLNSARIFIGAHQGVFISEDYGGTWRRIEGLTGNCFGLDITPDGQFVYAVAGNESSSAVLAYTVAAESWQDVGSSLPALTNSWWRPLIDPRSTASEHKILVGPVSGSSGAHLYEGAFSATGNAVTGSWSLIFDYDHPDVDRGWYSGRHRARHTTYTPVGWAERRVWAATEFVLYEGGLAHAGDWALRSTVRSGTEPGGQPVYSSRGFASTYNWDLAGSSNYLAQACADVGILESFDGGASWLRFNQRQGDALHVLKTEPPVVIAAISDGFGGSGTNGFLYAKELIHYDSRDGWKLVTAGSNALAGLSAECRISAIASDPSDPKRVIIGGRSTTASKSGLYEIADFQQLVQNGTGSFIRILSNEISRSVRNIFFDPNQSNRMFVYSQDGLFRCEKNGGVWSAVKIFDSGVYGWADQNLTVWSYNGQTRLAFAPSVAAENDSDPLVIGSLNAGASWSVWMTLGDAKALYDEGIWQGGIWGGFRAGGLCGFQNRLICTVINGVPKRKDIGVFSGEFLPDGTVEWTNWNSEGGRIIYGAARTAKVLEKNGEPWVYLATLGAGMWRRPVAELGGMLDRLGFTDVTLLGADPSGATDSTRAIQNAIYRAYANRQSVFFPEGTYLISDTLYACQPVDADNTNRYGHTLAGAYNRPLIRLADNAPGFSSRADPKPMIAMWRSAGVTNIVGETNYTAAARIDNQNYNQVVKNLRLNCGSGNSGAAAIWLRGAEGCAVQDVRISAYGAFCGLWDLPGSGGSVTGLEVYGGWHGIYATGAQPCPVVAGARFENQNGAAVYYNAGTPLTLVGFEIKRNATAPVFDGLWKTTSQRGSQEFWAMLNLVDGKIEASNISPVCLLHEDRPLYLRNVYFKGYSRIIENAAENDLRDYDTDPLLWTRVVEFADSPALTRDAPRLMEGVKTYDPAVRIETNALLPDIDFIARHKWNYGLGCADRPGVVSVKDFGAAGDGAADDTSAFQAAIEAARLVYVPPGKYKISDTLELKSDTELFASARDKTRIQATGFGNRAQPAPMISAPDSVSATTAVSSFMLDFLSPTNRVYPLLWQAGRHSVIRDIWPFPLEGVTAPFQRIRFKNSGGGRAYNFCLQRMDGGSDPDYQHLLVDGTSEPLTFYMLHNQHISCRYGSRALFRNSKNITVYGLKHESNLGDNPPAEDWPVSVAVTNCRNVQIIGMSGLAQTAPGRGLVEFSNSENVLLAGGASWDNTATGEVIRDDFFIKEFYGAQTNTVRAANTTVVNLFKRGQVSGTGGLFSSFEERSVPYSTWIFGRGLADESPFADPDGDGLPNALEYALGGNPAVPDAEQIAQISLLHMDGADRLTAVYTVNPEAGYLPFAVFADDLTGEWGRGIIFKNASGTVWEYSTNTLQRGFGRFRLMLP